MAFAKRDTSTREKGPAGPPHRAAAPGRELVSLTPRTGMAASTLATAAVLGTAGMGLAPAVSAVAATAVAAGFGARVAGRTLGQWMSLRRWSRTLPDQAALFSRDGVGVVFDGTAVTACVQITPRPWQLTTVSATGASQSPVISADLLRRQLRQYDIGLSRLNVICAGYKFVSRDHAANALDTLIGPVSVPLGGTTLIAVSLDLEADILGPSYRRARRESLPDGLCQTLTVAATRVCHALAEQGFGGELMSAHAIREFHDEVLDQVAKPMSSPRWRNCGERSGVHTRTFVPARGHWNAESAGGWNHLQAHRQYTTLTLTPQGDVQALAQPLITYLVRDGDAMANASGYGLRPAVGQQVAGLNQALPVSARMPLRSPAAVIDEHRQLGFGVPAGGAGMFIGSRADKTRVFVAVSPASEPLWLSGPKLFALQMVARLSTQNQTIAVMIDDPAWRGLVAHRSTASLTMGGDGPTAAAVVVCTPSWWERHRELCSGKAVMLVTEEAPGLGATNSLTVAMSDSAGKGKSEIEVSVDAHTARVLWELTPIERRELLGDVEAGGVTTPRAASPREGSDLNLGQVVELPVSAPPRPKRRPAPAPEVSTIGQVAEPEPGAEQVAPVKPPKPKRSLKPPRPAPPKPPRPPNLDTLESVKIPDKPKPVVPARKPKHPKPLSEPELDTLEQVDSPGEPKPKTRPRRAHQKQPRPQRPNLDTLDPVSIPQEPAPSQPRRPSPPVEAGQLAKPDTLEQVTIPDSPQLVAPRRPRPKESTGQSRTPRPDTLAQVTIPESPKPVAPPRRQKRPSEPAQLAVPDRDREPVQPPEQTSGRHHRDDGSEGEKP